MATGKKKKIKRNVPKATAFIKASFNNTIITIADPAGETLCWASSGSIGFKGSRKSTPFAAQRAAARLLLSLPADIALGVRALGVAGGEGCASASGSSKSWSPS